MEQEIERGTRTPRDQGRPELRGRTLACSHPGCRCTLDSRYVFLRDRAFCSGDCADGSGCDHEDCHCGTVRAAPGFASLLHGAVRHLHRANGHKGNSHNE
jgi:hypothetical protein